MKKKLLFLFALICSVSIFSSCGDDDKDTTWTQIPDATKENTKLTINGGTLPDATASLDIQSAEAAVLKLTNAIYGHDDISVNVAVVKSNDSTYVFEGTANLDGAISKATAAVDKGLTVAAKGTVTLSGKLTVEVTTSGWGTLSGVYSGDSLKITVNGEEASNKYPATFTAESESKATVVFDKIQNVANDFSMEVTLTKDGEGYKFEGTKDMKPGYHVTVSGTVAKNVLTAAVTTSGYAVVSKPYSGSSLVYTYNGGTLTSVGLFGTPSVNLSFEENTLDITLSNAVLGLYVTSSNGEIVIKGVKYTKATDSETYSFSGTVSPEGFKATTLTFEGTVSADKVLTLSLNNTIKSDIVGKWSMEKTSEGLGKTFFDFKTNSGMVNLPDSIYNFVPENIQGQIPQQMSDQAFQAFVKQMLGQYTVFLKSIEFKADGNIVVIYNNINGGAEQTLEGFMNYSITDKGKLLIVPNIGSLMGGMMSQTASLKSYDPYDPSNILMGDGIPFNYKLNGSELLVTLDKGVIYPLGSMAQGFIPIIGAFVPQLAEILPMINVILPGTLNMLEDIPTLEIGLYLNK